VSLFKYMRFAVLPMFCRIGVTHPFFVLAAALPPWPVGVDR